MTQYPILKMTALTTLDECISHYLQGHTIYFGTEGYNIYGLMPPDLPTASELEREFRLWMPHGRPT